MPNTPLHRQEEDGRRGRFAAGPLVDARVGQLIGLCRGVLADRHLHDSEIVALDQWIATHGGDLPEWPWNALANSLKTVLEDGIIEDVERTDLLAFLDRITGEDSGRNDAPSSLPYTQPPPFIEYVGRSFCLTGTFIFGTRTRVRNAIENEGGRVVESPTSCDFLVIGGTITPAWKYGAWGRKIESAVEARSRSGQPAIVSEENWAATLC